MQDRDAHGVSVVSNDLGDAVGGGIIIHAGNGISRKAFHQRDPCEFSVSPSPKEGRGSGEHSVFAVSDLNPGAVGGGWMRFFLQIGITSPAIEPSRYVPIYLCSARGLDFGQAHFAAYLVPLLFSYTLIE